MITPRQMLLSSSKYSLKCPYTMNATSITIHNTANKASANNEIQYMITNDTSTSYHFAIDDKEVVQGVPLDRNAFHAGDGSKEGSGNRTSIGIEICYSLNNEDQPKYLAAEQLTIKFVAQLLKERNWGTDRVKKHQDWSGKYCPHRILDRTGGWANFLHAVQVELDNLYKADKPQVQPAQTKVAFKIFNNITEVDGQIIEGRTHVQIRDMIAKLNAYGGSTYTVSWDGKNVVINDVGTENLNILRKIAMAEAGGEDEKGIMLVVNVIMNRVNDKAFPNTIKDVVFAPNQFEPTRNGAYDKAIPSEKVKIAVGKALAIDDSQGATYFRTIKGATPDCWHEKALTKLFDHGGHRFYK